MSAFRIAFDDYASICKSDQGIGSVGDHGAGECTQDCIAMGYFAIFLFHCFQFPFSFFFETPLQRASIFCN